MTTFRRPEYGEQDMLVKGLTEINKEKRGRFIFNALVWGFIYVLMVGALVCLCSKDSAREVKRYTGFKPSFERYEDYIMNSIFAVETDVSPMDIPQDVDIESWTHIPYLFSPTVTYSIRLQPEDYNYADLDFNRINRQNGTFHIAGRYPLPKDSPSYIDAARRAKALFDKEIDNRAELAHKIEMRHLTIILILCAIYAIAMVFLGIELKKKCNKRIDDIKQGKILVAKGVLIGRERIRGYRSSDRFAVETLTEDGKKWKIRVKYLQYSNFNSNVPCLLVKYDEEDGSYDEYDVIWKMNMEI